MSPRGFPAASGLNNLIEYVFNLDPNVRDAARGQMNVTSTNDGAFADLTYRLSPEMLSAGDYTLHISTSIDLSSWIPATIHSETNGLTDGGATHLKTQRVSLGSDPRRFFRLEIREP